MSEPGCRVTGNVRVEERVKGRVWVAAFIQADGTKTQDAWAGVGEGFRAAVVAWGGGVAGGGWI